MSITQSSKSGNKNKRKISFRNCEKFVICRSFRDCFLRWISRVSQFFCSAACCTRTCVSRAVATWWLFATRWMNEWLLRCVQCTDRLERDRLIVFLNKLILHKVCGVQFVVLESVVLVSGRLTFDLCSSYKSSSALLDIHSAVYLIRCGAFVPDNYVWPSLPQFTAKPPSLM